MNKLVFVYNGGGGLVNGVMHYLHKRISPDTYPCELCGMVYDGMSMKRECQQLIFWLWQSLLCMSASLSWKCFSGISPQE